MDSYFDRCLKGPPFLENEEKKYEFKRFTSFEHWPKDSPVFPIKLSKAGFYYSGTLDEVSCFQCGVKKSGWKSEDDPSEVHRILSPDCEFISESNSVNVSVGLNTDPEESSLIQRLNSLDLQASSENEQGAVAGSANNQSVETQSSETARSVAGTQNKISGVTSSQTGTQLSSESLVPRSQSAGQLNQKKTSNTNFTAQSGSRSVANLNIADSAVVPPQTAGSSTESSLTSTPTTTTRNTNKTTSKAKTKKSAKKTSENSSSARSNSSGEVEVNPNMESRSGDIPPPSGESIGPLRFERNRLETFKKWPSNACVPAGELAKCGFTYTGSGDRVQCVFCKGILRNWEEGDRPQVEHRKHFARCPMVLGTATGNVPIPLPVNHQQQVNRPINVADMASLGVVTERPKHPQYAIEAQRLASFRNWPTNKTQTPPQLAQAGFWYAGFSDNVKCFFCDGGLRNWERGDDPWSEHARWFPTCPFVRQVKSEEFIKEIQTGKNGDVPILAQVQAQRRQATETPSNIPGQATGQQYRVEEREIRARMDRPDVKRLEDMDISKEVIMKALRKRLMETGDDFPTAQSLLEAVFAMQDEEKELSQNASQSQNRPDSQSGSEAGVSGETGSQSPVSNSTGETTHSKQIAKSEVATHGGTGKGENTIKERQSKPGRGPGKGENTIKERQSKPGPDLSKENQELREQRLCKICLDQEANVVFLPCGHLVSCAACCPALVCCPICRADIKGTVRTFLA